MRTVKQIREELYWAKDNGLTNEQIEALELEMWEVETIECNTMETKEELSEMELWEMIWKHTNSRMQRTSNEKYWNFVRWFKKLSYNDRLFVAQNFPEIYKNNTAYTFDKGFVK
jgi:CRISPR/Cas system type I-B associated protein Csh2 (Cas7 group RAMP superfamily)